MLTTATRPPPAPAQARLEPLYVPLDFMIVRAPLLPIETYQALTAPARADQDAASPPVSESPLLRDPQIRRALGVGSRALLDALERSERVPLTQRDAARLHSKLLRYLIRMSTRPTPYGLFAGVALGNWGQQTDLALATTAAPTRTRPDMGWLLRLVAELEARPEVRHAGCLVANPRALIHAGRVVLIERASLSETTEVQSVSVRATGVVRRALALARRPIPYPELAAALLAATPGATPEKVERLLTELWQQTLLLTDLRPPLTSSSPAQYVLERLAAIPAAIAALEQLRAVLDAAAAWDDLSPAEAPAAYQCLVAQAYALIKPADKEESPFQVDSALALRGTVLHEAVGTEVTRAAELLLRLSPAPNGPAYLHAYRQAFHNRYGHDREVPLLELLDPNLGLGPPNWYSGSAGLSQAKANLRSQLLRDLACRALYEHQRVVELDADLQARLETWTPSPATAPPSLDLYAFVAAPSAVALDAGNFQVIIGPNLGALQAGRNLGRFADLLAPAAPAALERAARREEAQDPSRVWAELVYLPRQPRWGNVSIRPAVRAYELALGVSPGVPADRVIPAGELLVGVRENRFYLRWPAGRREVLVTAGHMLNTLNAPTLVRFLSDLPHDGQVMLNGFDWGPAASFPYLPRVQAGRIILRPAQWTVDKATLPPELSDGFAAALDEWRRRWDVPRHVALTFSDNRLILDLDDSAQANELRAEVRGLPEGESLLLQEVLPAFDQVWLPGPGGRYVTELVVSLGLRGDIPTPGSPAASPVITQLPPDTLTPRADSGISAPDLRSADAAASPVPTITLQEDPNELISPSLRLRPPGSDWLFVKLYCARLLEDDLLADPIRTFADAALAAGWADEWFFIRYSDPDSHLRLRFHGVPEHLTATLLPRLCAWAADLMAEGHCHRFALDTYDREVERYGGLAGTAVAESIFAADSRAVAALLQLVQDHEVALDPTTLAALSVDDLLGGLGLTLAERLAWYKAVAEETRDAVGKAYRARKTVLRALLDDPARLAAEPGGPAVAAILAGRRAALVSLGVRLTALAAAGTLTQPLSTLCGSFVHLHSNRLLGVATDERQILGLLLRTREGLAHPKPAHARI